MISSFLKSKGSGTIVFLSRESKLPIQSVFSKDKVKVFWEIDDVKKNQFIKDYFSLNKRQISVDALEFLVDNLENNKKMIKNELDKILSYKTGEIQESDVEEFLLHSKEENVFSLFSHIAKRDFSKSLISFSIIFLQRKSDFDMILILATLEGQIKKAFAVKELYIQSKNLNDAFNKMFIKSRNQKESFSNFVKNYSKVDILRAIKTISRLNTMVRSQGNFSKIYIEIFIYEFIYKSKESIFFKSREKLFSIF